MTKQMFLNLNLFGKNAVRYNKLLHLNQHFFLLILCKNLNFYHQLLMKHKKTMQNVFGIGDVVTSLRRHSFKLLPSSCNDCVLFSHWDRIKVMKQRLYIPVNSV